jgi:hypothetical protein
MRQPGRSVQLIRIVHANLEQDAAKQQQQGCCGDGRGGAKASWGSADLPLGGSGEDELYGGLLSNAGLIIAHMSIYGNNH